METATKIDVSDLVDHARMGAFHFRIVIICGICVMIAGFDVQALGYAAPALIRDWQIAGSALGPAFSAALVGVLVGSLLFSPIADRIGRRPMLIAATLFSAVLTLWTARVTSINELLVIRFFAGVGLGGIVPNALPLAGEYTPIKSRVAVMMLIANSFNIGAAAGGFVAAWLIPNFGWGSVFFF